MVIRVIRVRINDQLVLVQMDLVDQFRIVLKGQVVVVMELEVIMQILEPEPEVDRQILEIDPDRPKVDQIDRDRIQTDRS